MLEPDRDDMSHGQCFPTYIMDMASLLGTILRPNYKRDPLCPLLRVTE